LSGLWITLASTSGPNAITLTAAANPAASQLTAGQILFTPSPCSTTASTSTSYIGTLTRQ
jgi:hypothetical protein